MSKSRIRQIEGIICPRCNNNNCIVTRDITTTNKPIYKCCSCNKRFVLNPHSGRGRTLDVLPITCIYCGMLGCVDAKTRVRCIHCKNKFVNSPDRDATGYLKRGRKPISHQLIPHLTCPTCNHNIYKKAGHNKQGQQLYKCKQCSCVFTNSLKDLSNVLSSNPD